jgi:RimJ/RimL family protein N-acetyltransferase
LIPLITSIPIVFSEESGTAYIERQWSRYNERTGYSFAIAEAHTDNAVGSVYLGLRNIEEGRASIGYWIVRDYRGRGIAKMALKQITEWAQNELRIPRLELYVEPWNIGSIKTAEAAGFKQEGLMRSWQKVGDERKDMIMMSCIL